ncbi:hypothetical protein ABEW34_20590 [Paenibacillus algorifonticola]|uniref:hypothetical protein n=1 Tax=Paenibacillus algorifonticola TaxID=684063 RepID=UPI003D2A4CF6
MSVSLALIPVALTLRVVMGKKNFENFANSMQVKEPTNFRNELELVRTVRKAGYDAEKWLGIIKTHIDGDKQFITWEHVDGKWQAIFTKLDSREMIESFMHSINYGAGRNVFDSTAVGYSARPIQLAPAAQLPSYPTNFRDGELLFRTLKEFGVNPLRQDDAIICKVERSVLTFRQFDDHPFQVEIQNPPDLKTIYEYLSDVDEDYKRCLQDMVYQKLIKRAAEKKMSVESEQVLEDNSIVITLNVER